LLCKLAERGGLSVPPECMEPVGTSRRQFLRNSEQVSDQWYAHLSINPESYKKYRNHEGARRVLNCSLGQRYRLNAAAEEILRFLILKEDITPLDTPRKQYPISVLHKLEETVLRAFDLRI
jgi:hypothetical protein